MYVLFCADPLASRKPDSTYQEEYQAAGDAGFKRGMIVLEDLIYSGNAASAVRGIPFSDSPIPAIYRGWMLKPEQYTALYDELLKRGIHLITSPDAYRHTHYLPESYPIIAQNTPKTTWLSMASQTPMSDILAQLNEFGDQPVILKDYVKSQKHYWHEACFIPRASDHQHAEKVIRRFMELQADDLNIGLVFRAYADLESLGQHAQSGMPTAREYRVFYWNGVPLITSPYWESGEASPDLPPIEMFGGIAKQIRSPFFTMDVAKLSGGGWIIVELGDGQVAGLPTMVTPTAFYTALRERIG